MSSSIEINSPTSNAVKTIKKSSLKEWRIARMTSMRKWFYFILVFQVVGLLAVLAIGFDFLDLVESVGLSSFALSVSMFFFNEKQLKTLKADNAE